MLVATYGLNSSCIDSPNATAICSTLSIQRIAVVGLLRRVFGSTQAPPDLRRRLKIIEAIVEAPMVERILTHLELQAGRDRGPGPRADAARGPMALETTPVTAAWRHDSRGDLPIARAKMAFEIPMLLTGSTADGGYAPELKELLAGSGLFLGSPEQHGRVFLDLLRDAADLGHDLRDLVFD